MIFTEKQEGRIICADRLKLLKKKSFRTDRIHSGEFFPLEYKPWQKKDKVRQENE